MHIACNISPIPTLTLSVVQEWLNKRNTTTVAKFLDTSVCGGSWGLDPSLSPFLVKFTQILESILLDNPHKAVVLSVGCASFSSTQLSVNMLGYSTLWTASFFGNECLWLTLLVKGVNDCLLDNCQISSLPHDCVAKWTKLRDHFEGSGTLCRCFELITWLACHHILICWDHPDFSTTKPCCCNRCSGFALSCWNAQGLPWNRCHLEGSICCSKNLNIPFSIHSAFQNMQAAHTVCTYAPQYHQRFWLFNWTLITRWKVSLLFSPEDTASMISNKKVKSGLVWP